MPRNSNTSTGRSYRNNNQVIKSNPTKQQYSPTEKKVINKKNSLVTSSPKQIPAPTLSQTPTKNDKCGIISTMKDSFIQGVGFSLAHNIVSGFFRDNKPQNNEIKNEVSKKGLYEYTSDECYKKRNEYHSCKIFSLSEDCNTIKKEDLYEFCFDNR